MAKTKYEMLTKKSFDNIPFYASPEAEKNESMALSEREVRAEEIDENPLRVRLDLTNKCNVQCVFCYRDHFRTDEHSISVYYTHLTLPTIYTV